MRLDISANEARAALSLVIESPRLKEYSQRIPRLNFAMSSRLRPSVHPSIRHRRRRQRDRIRISRGYSRETVRTLSASANPRARARVVRATIGGNVGWFTKGASGEERRKGGRGRPSPVARGGDKESGAKSKARRETLRLSPADGVDRERSRPIVTPAD